MYTHPLQLKTSKSTISLAESTLLHSNSQLNMSMYTDSTIGIILLVRTGQGKVLTAIQPVVVYIVARYGFSRNISKYTLILIQISIWCYTCYVNTALFT